MPSTYDTAITRLGHYILIFHDEYMSDFIVDIYIIFDNDIQNVKNAVLMLY